MQAIGWIEKGLDATLCLSLQNRARLNIQLGDIVLTLTLGLMCRHLPIFVFVMARQYA